MEDVLKSEYHKPPLRYDNVDWFVNEVIKLENKMSFYYKNTKKDIKIIEEDDKDLERFLVFVKNILNLIKLEIIVTWLVIIEEQLITLVI